MEGREGGMEGGEGRREGGRGGREGREGGGEGGEGGRQGGERGKEGSDAKCHYSYGFSTSPSSGAELQVIPYQFKFHTTPSDLNVAIDSMDSAWARARARASRALGARG